MRIKLKETGANCGVLTGVKMFSKQVEVFGKEDRAKFIGWLNKEIEGKFCINGIPFVKDVSEAVHSAKLMYVLNNLHLLDQDDKNGDVLILDNVNCPYSYFPKISEYDDKMAIKVKKYGYTLETLEEVGKILLRDSFLEKDIDLAIMDIFCVVFEKIKGFKTQLAISHFSDLKERILNSNEVREKIKIEENDGVRIDINKQGVKGNVVGVYRSISYMTNKESAAFDEYRVCQYKIERSNLNAMTLPSLFYINDVDMKKERFTASELFKYVKDIEKKIRFYKIEPKDGILSFILKNVLHLSFEGDKIFITARKQKKEILMNNFWIKVGKDVSFAIEEMHKNKKGLDFDKAVDSTTKELRQSLERVFIENRGKELFSKYVTKKFNMNKLYSIEDIESFLKISNDDWFSFVAGITSK